MALLSQALSHVINRISHEFDMQNVCIMHEHKKTSSFRGSSSGTAVKLQMGRYSVIETKQSHYNSTFSGDCSGGMMFVETKNCTITDIYFKADVGAK